MCNQKDNSYIVIKKHLLTGGEKIIIREAIKGDAMQLIEYLSIIDTETRFLAREPGEFSFTVKEEESFIESYMLNDKAILLVGIIDGKVIANASVHVGMNTKRFAHRAAMGIAIRKQYWNKGIGSLLIGHCIDWCKSNGIEQLELDVVTDNERAISLYEKYGFKVYGTKPKALKYSNGEYRDEYYMVLNL